MSDNNENKKKDKALTIDEFIGVKGIRARMAFVLKKKADGGKKTLKQWEKVLTELKLTK
jgi:hypothetical protein